MPCTYVRVLNSTNTCCFAPLLLLNYGFAIYIYNSVTGITNNDNISDTYARVKDGTVSSAQRSSSRINKLVNPVQNSHSYAEVKNIGDATYAQISEKPQSSKRKTVKSTDSTDTLDPSLVPPVPDKLPDLMGPSSNRSSNAVGSPSLPPRNSILDRDNIPYADDAR